MTFLIRYAIKIALILVSFSALCEDRDSLLIELVSENIYEASTSGFSDVESSSIYIEKYNLNYDEVQNVGVWFVDDYLQDIKIQNSGLGISIRFLPNRLFTAYRDHAEEGDVQYTFGGWKVENKVLKIRPRARAILIGTNQWKFEYLNSGRYYPIYTIRRYDVAMLNESAYSFDKIPSKIRSFYVIDDNDLPRCRLLFDTLGDPPGDISLGSEYWKILNCRSFDPEHLKKMISCW